MAAKKNNKTVTVTASRNGSNGSAQASARDQDVDAFLAGTTQATQDEATDTQAAPVEENTFNYDGLGLDEVIIALTAVKGTYNALEAQMRTVKDHALRLYTRYQTLRDGEMAFLGMTSVRKPLDKRKMFNPLKNLKISINIAYRWAVDFGASAAVAKQRAIDAVMDSARKKYADDPEIAPWLAKDKVPPALMEYIDAAHKDYAKMKLKGSGEPEPDAAEAVSNAIHVPVPASVSTSVETSA